MWKALGEDKSEWTQAERVVIGCTQFNINIGNGFWNFTGCVHPRHFFNCLEGLRAVRNNLSTRTAELAASLFAEYGIMESDEATWDNIDELDDASYERLEARVREIDERFIKEIWNDKGADSLREALQEYIQEHIAEFRRRKCD
jgi:hypothetical protein